MRFYAGLFVFGLACFVLSGFSIWQAYKLGVAEGLRINPPCTTDTLEPTPSQYEMDNMCITWLMESNIKEAKRRICGK